MQQSKCLLHTLVVYQLDGSYKNVNSWVVVNA